MKKERRGRLHLQTTFEDSGSPSLCAFDGVGGVACDPEWVLEPTDITTGCQEAGY